MRPDARAWFRHRTTSATSLAELDLPALLRAKRRGGHRISVVLPARNEAATAIYRNNVLSQVPGKEPETLPCIVGPAVLFSRRVWF